MSYREELVKKANEAPEAKRNKRRETLKEICNIAAAEGNFSTRVYYVRENIDYIVRQLCIIKCKQEIGADASVPKHEIIEFAIHEKLDYEDLKDEFGNPYIQLSWNPEV